jgi:hypothetical protein
VIAAECIQQPDESDLLTVGMKLSGHLERDRPPAE